VKSLAYKILSIPLILSFTILCGLEGPWPGDDDSSGSSASTSANDPIETLSTTTDATVDTIGVTTMDVETDDGVILTCDLPSGVVLVVGDRVEITINFESNESMWVITGTEFFQKL